MAELARAVGGEAREQSVDGTGHRLGFPHAERPARRLRDLAALRSGLAQPDQVAGPAVAGRDQQERERARTVRVHRLPAHGPRMVSSTNTTSVPERALAANASKSARA